MHVYSFVAPQQTTTFSTDVKEFFDYLGSNYAFPLDQQHLLSKYLPAQIDMLRQAT
jgi:hypothetical protein